MVSNWRSVRVSATASLIPRSYKGDSALVDDGDADPATAAGRVGPIGNHVERAQKNFERRFLLTREPGCDLFGRHAEESGHAGAAAEDLLCPGKGAGIPCTLVHARADALGVPDAHVRLRLSRFLRHR